MKTVIDWLWRAWLLLFLFSAVVKASSFKPPDISPEEVRYYKSYYARKEDQPDLAVAGSRLMHNESSKSFSEWAEWQSGALGKVLIVTRDAISYGDTRSFNRFFLRVTPKGLVMLKFERRWNAPDGSLLRIWDFDFTDSSVKYPPDTFHHMLMPWLARSLDYNSLSPVYFNAWLDTTMVYPMYFQVEGTEKVTVSAGTFECYKVVAKLDKAKLDDVIAKLLGRTMPRYTYWMEKGGTHGLVKLQWPIFTGAYGGQERFQTQELVKIGKRIEQP